MTEQEYKEQSEKCNEYAIYKREISMNKDAIRELSCATSTKEICDAFYGLRVFRITTEVLTEAKEQLISRLQDKIEETEKYLEEL